MTRRGAPPPIVEFYSLMQQRVACLQKLVPLLAVVAQERGHAPMDVRPSNSFRQLVQQIQANHGA